MTDHPNARRLDGLAAGCADPGAEAHLADCAACARYVEGLREGLPAPSAAEADAFVASLVERAAGAEPRPAAPAPRKRPGLAPRARVVALAAGPLLAAAALLLLFLRAAPPPSPPPGHGASEGPVRFKGEVAVAVIRERGGEQERLVHEASVRAGDRIRLEVSCSAGGPLAAGVLADDGAWLPLLEAPRAETGTHFSERSARFDAEPTEGFVLAGRPDEVERARQTRRFEGVAALRLRYERGP